MRGLGSRCWDLLGWHGFDLWLVLRSGWSPSIHGVSENVGQPQAQGAQRDGAVEPRVVALVGPALHDMSDTFVNDELRQDVLAERALDVGRRGQGAAAQVELVAFSPPS